MNETSASSNPLSRERFAALRRRYEHLSIDELIDLLSSEDLQTRFFAEMTLRDKTST